MRPSLDLGCSKSILYSHNFWFW